MDRWGFGEERLEEDVEDVGTSGWQTLTACEKWRAEGRRLSRRRAVNG